MFRPLLAGLLSIACCSCATLDHPRPSGGIRHGSGRGIRINDPSFRINIDRGELQFSKSLYLTPVPQWTYKNTDPGTVYFVKTPTGETPASCTYTSDTVELSVSDLVDYLNLNCLPSGCRLSIKNPPSTIVELDASCAKEITFVVRKSGWSKSAGITITLAPGDSTDLAQVKTSPLVGSYTVVN